MGFLDELRKLTQPYDDEDDFFEGAETNLRPQAQQPSAAQIQFENAFGEDAGVKIEPEDAPKEEQPKPAQQPAAGAGNAGGGLFGGFGFKKGAKARRERVVEFGGSEQQVILFNPKTFDEAGELVSHLGQGRSVVMTLEGIPTDSARRLLDFLSGITFALGGKITPISAKTYFVTPQNVDVLGSQPDAAESDGQYL